MIQFFRKIRQGLLTENKISKYLLYAVGEIVLVVIGILIALSINNWNERKNQEQSLHNIYELVATDLEGDIKAIDFVLDNLEKEAIIIEKVLNNTITQADYEENPMAVNVIIGSTDLPLNSRGFDLLSAFNNESKTDQSQLSSRILQFYLSHDKTLKADDQLRLNDIENTITDWKNKYNWYADRIIKKDLSGFIDYALNDPDYKNRVANYYLLNHVIYIPLLKKYKEQSLDFIREIRTSKDTVNVH